MPGLYETLWGNGGIQILYHDYWNIDVDYTSTVGVGSFGNDIYVAAQMTSDSGTKNSGGYFKNGSWKSIDNGSFRPNRNALDLAKSEWSARFTTHSFVSIKF